MGAPNGPHLVDAVSLAGLDVGFDISGELHRNGQTPDPIDNLWDNLPYRNATVGVFNQILVSLGIADSYADWIEYGTGPIGQARLKAIDTFRYQMDPYWFPPLYFPTNELPPLTTTFLAPFTPIKRVLHTTSWQANDPLVHYTLDRLRPGTNLTRIDHIRWFSPIFLLRDFNLGRLNDRYRPWGGRFGGATVDFNPALLDPLVCDPDCWDFPVGQALSAAWLGRIHRGTPWQTLYVKSAAGSLEEWLQRGGDPGSHPTNDWATMEVLISLLNTDHPLDLVSVNDANLTSWLSVLGGVLVVTNTPSGCLLQLMESNALAVTLIFQGIQRERAKQRGGHFRALAGILSVPELSLGSPWLDAADSEKWVHCLESSANLTTWETLGCRPAQNGRIELTLPDPASARPRFFRARLAPKE